MTKFVSPEDRLKAINLSQEEIQALRLFTKYIWWDPEEEVLKRPDLLIAQIMDIGDYDDVCRLIEIVGKNRLCYVLQNAEAGQFHVKSWYYWHYRLLHTPLEEVPPLPKRTFM